MDILAVLAFLAFVVGAVLGFVRRDWAPAFIATGLALLALGDVGLKIG